LLVNGTNTRQYSVSFASFTRSSPVSQVVFSFFLLDNGPGSRYFDNSVIRNGAFSAQNCPGYAAHTVEPGHIFKPLERRKAIKFLSQVYTAARGKVGGIVYTKNQFAGLVARAFNAPTNPKTDKQVLIRSSFADSSARWQNATPADREAWEDYAATLVYPGPLGEFKLPGRQVFLSNLALALYCEQIGGSSIAPGDDPPIIAGFLNPGPIAPGTFVTASETGIAIDIGNNTGEDAVALVNMSVVFELTRQVYYGPWASSRTFCVDIADGATTVIPITLNAAAEGKRVFTRVRLISEAAPHRISPFYISSHVPVTNGP